MFNALFIQHDKINRSLLDEIIQVKTVAWPYSNEQQLNWIKNNLKDSDIHALLYDNEKVVAYLNLVKVEIQIDSKRSSALGVGNVCAAQKGKGWGKVLMTKVNEYLVEENSIGLLFCKDKLVKFYNENNWLLLEKEQQLISNLNPEIYTLAYNLPENFNHVKYEGVLF
jgi:hypothetical protein